jgi:hypothetical protein
MQAAIWGMEHFGNYLKGHHFTLFTDHKPLEKLGKVHKKTLNRLQEMMSHYSFDIMYKPGNEMPADFLSRHAVDTIGLQNSDLIEKQENYSFISRLKNFLLNRELPENEKTRQLIFAMSKDCFVSRRVAMEKND